MGGFHLIDLIVILGIVLALFGSKALQSVARGAGKGMGQAKAAKEKVLAELPMEEISKVTESIPRIPRIPLNASQAVQMLLTPEKGPEQQKKVEPKQDEQGAR